MDYVNGQRGGQTAALCRRSDAMYQHLAEITRKVRKNAPRKVCQLIALRESAEARDSQRRAEYEKVMNAIYEQGTAIGAVERSVVRTGLEH